MQADVSERFWPKVDKSGDCWLWTACLFSNSGYGMFSYRRRLTGAHRVAWELTNGPIPDGLWVLHHCDNRPCVRPSHLYLGTQRENGADMARRLRATHGRAHHSNRLTEDQVRMIRLRLSNGEPIAPMAREYGVTYTAILYIRIGRNWSWLT